MAVQVGFIYCLGLVKPWSSMPNRQPKSAPKNQAYPQPEVSECCETAPLSAQEDFKSTRSRLKEIIEDAGHIFVG